MYDRRADAAHIDRVVRQMQRVLDVPSVTYTVQRAAGTGIGCVNVVRGTAGASVARDFQRGVWLMLDGEIYSADGLRTGDVAEGDPAAVCLAGYLNEGEAFVRHLNGQFNLIVYHEVEGTLLIATDRYGYRPLFLAQEGSRLLFATEMKAIIVALEAVPRPDEIGVLWLAGAGRLFGDRTWLEPIRVVDPGTIMTVSERGASRRRYFQLRFSAPARATSLDDFADGFAAALDRAATRMTQGPGRVGVTLSGGLDSRAALLALSRHDRLTAACTFGDPSSRDARYAQQLASIAGVPHVQWRYAPGYLGRVLVPIVWRTEGLVPFAWTQYTSLNFHAEIEARLDVLVYGHCGDALTGAHLRPDLILARSRRQLIDRIVGHHQQSPAAMLERVFNPRFYRHAAPAALDALRATFSDIDQETLGDVADVWDMEHQQRRGPFHSSTLDRYRFEVRTVFLDNDLVDHLLQAPLRWRFQQLAYKRMIVTAFPAAVHVPWAYTDRRIRPDMISDLADVGWNFVRKRLRRGWARVTATSAALPGESFRELAADLRAAPDVAQAIRDFVTCPCFPDDIFDRDGIADIVQRHWERRENHAHLVIMLATFATAWRLLLAERPATMPAEAQPPTNTGA